MQYTKEQQKVINHKLDKHALVSAVAGSGKTQTLIARIKYLIDNKVQPSKILVLMFNKSIQMDFRNRLISDLGFELASQVNIKTTHSLGFQFLKSLEKAGLVNFKKLLTNDFEINKILDKNLRKAQLEHKVSKRVDLERVAEFKDNVSILKSTLSLNHKKIDELKPKDKKLLYRVFELYQEELEKQGILTFDDMLYKVCDIFSKNKAVAEKAKGLYSHIIVDEYQDINEVQQYFIKSLVDETTAVMVVGDVDQSIYGWRGSTPYYMLEGFKKDFPSAKHFTLSYTFRYGDLISLMANNIITNNTKRHKNLCVTYPNLDRKSGVSINTDPNSIVLSLKELLSQGVPISEMAVLVRKYNSTTVFELSCLYNDLPYRVEEGKNIFEEPLFLAIYGYLMLFDNAKGFKNYEQQDRVKIVKAMLDYPSLYLQRDVKESLAQEISKNLTKAPDFIEFLAENVDKVFKEKNIKKIVTSWKGILSSSKTKNVEKGVEFILETLDLVNILQKSKQNTQTYSSQSKLNIIEGVSQFAKSKNVSLDEFVNMLYELHFKSNLESNDGDKLLITSMHKAKGLEWQYVVLYDITEGAFFGEQLDKLTDDTIEEERRLFYVAITRVKKHLFIVSSSDKHRIQEWYKLNTNKFPKNLKCNNSLRFLFEANLNESKSFIETVNTSERVEYKGMFKKYLEKLKDV